MKNKTINQATFLFSHKSLPQALVNYEFKWDELNLLWVNKMNDINVTFYEKLGQSLKKWNWNFTLNITRFLTRLDENRVCLYLQWEIKERIVKDWQTQNVNKKTL